MSTGRREEDSVDEKGNAEELQAKSDTDSELQRDVADRLDGPQDVKDGNLPDTTKDLEKGSDEPPREAETNRENHDPAAVRPVKSNDPYLVTWDGDDDPENPLNWPIRRKWTVTFFVSCFTLISPVSSSMVAPAAAALKRDLHLTSDIEASLSVSIFVLAFACGPLLFAPLSEVYGRVRTLQYGNLIYVAWNLGCGFAKNGPEMFVFRFLSGIGGSATQGIGAGVMSDCWTADQRGKAIGIYSLMPLLGPALGPIIGGFITEYTTWRWVFWATTCADIVVQGLGIIFLKESYKPLLLQRKAARKRKETGNPAYYSAYDNDINTTLWGKLGPALARPFRLLFTQPIIIIVALYLAYLYGVMYLVLVSFPRLWTVRYNESTSIGSLNYISLGFGFFSGVQISAPINDRIYRKLKKRNNGVGRPEFRVPLISVGSIITPIGIFLYGWSAQARTHWIVPNIGAFIFSAGIIISFNGMQTYVVDAYTRYAASGIAAVVVLRSLAGFGFPLFAEAMYDALDYGWGNSVLAFVSIAVGIPMPIIFWKYGEKLRAKSQYAAGGSN